MSDIGTLIQGLDYGTIDPDMSQWITIRRIEYNQMLVRINELERQLLLAQATDDTRRQQVEAACQERDEAFHNTELYSDERNACRDSARRARWTARQRRLRCISLAQMLEQSEANCERYHDEVVKLRGAAK